MLYFLYTARAPWLAATIIVQEEAWLRYYVTLLAKSETSSKYNPVPFTTRPRLEPGATASRKEIEPRGSIREYTVPAWLLASRRSPSLLHSCRTAGLPQGRKASNSLHKHLVVHDTTQFIGYCARVFARPDWSDVFRTQCKIRTRVYSCVVLRFACVTAHNAAQHVHNTTQERNGTQRNGRPCVIL